MRENEYDDILYNIIFVTLYIWQIAIFLNESDIFYICQFLQVSSQMIC